jgi:fengycin family lipopeptide synthetase D
MRLDSLPMTSSGKVDKKLLPDINIGMTDESAIHHKMSRLERAVAKVWVKVLGVESVGPDDDFFFLGGDSAAVIRAQIELMKTGKRIRTQEFYENPTLRSLCAGIEGRESNGRHCGLYPQSLPAKIPAYTPGCFPTEKVLLTGATGFLGAHVLRELVGDAAPGVMRTAEYRPLRKIVCLVRGASDNESRERLLDVVRFYFGDDAEDIMRGVTVVSGDLESPLPSLIGCPPNGFGGEKSDGSDNVGPGFHALPQWGEFVPDTVINCAALTSHYGSEEVFIRANVKSVENLIELCKRTGAGLCHVSTMSVSGDSIESRTPSAVFTESDFYIGQNYGDSPYVKSKFLSEAAILRETEGGAGHECNEESKDKTNRSPTTGLKAKIMRAGNLMPRQTDGVFQIDSAKNAFFNRLRALKSIGAAPESLIEKGAEFTPVDLCARAIVLLAGGDEDFMYHLYNPFNADGQDVIDALNANAQSSAVGADASVRLMTDGEFAARVAEVMLTDAAESLSGIVEDMAGASITGRDDLIMPKCDRTVETLKKLGFEWKKPDREYLKKALREINCRGGL